MSKKVLIFSGSDRVGSFNTQVAEQFAVAISGYSDFAAEVYDYADVPLLNEDIEFPTPEQVVRLRAAIDEAAAVLFVSPEYNGSYPARMKNLIDWASRKQTQDGTPSVLVDKKVAIAAAAYASFGSHVRENLLRLLPFTKA
ncbi:MAG: NADPH-dependent FMN reductase, partial [Microbacteriaceae bacterium]|nr:NADPH-dependent FMN reductase [Microbacteriaceae bacterium]